MNDNNKNSKLSRRKLIVQTGVLTTGFALGINPFISACQNLKSGTSKRNHIMFSYVWRLSSTPGGNIGDYSIAPGMVTLLNHHFSDNQITAVTTSRVDDDISNDLYGFPECEVVGDVFSDAYRVEQARLEKEYGGSMPLVNDSNIDIVFDKLATGVVNELKHTHPRFVELLQKTRLLIYTSGMILVYGEGTLAGENFWGYTIRRSLPLLVAWKLGIPYGIYAHSFDSFGPAEGPGQPYFKKLLENARFVFCRDGNSVEYVKKLRIDAPHLMFVPDSTISADRRDDDWANDFMNRNGLESKQFMVVIPRTWQGGGMISPTIGRERSLNHMEKLRQIVISWVQHTGMKVVIGAEVFRDHPNALEFVYEKLPKDIKTKCVFLDQFWTTEQAVALYRQTRIVVTMELHSFLMAIPQGTPTVVPTFKESGRKIWMVKDFKLSKWLFDIDEASTEQITQTIADIHDNYKQQSKRIETEVIPHIRQLEQQAMEIIEQSLTDRNK